MTQFLGDLAFVFELFAVSAGLVLLHRAGEASKATLLRVASWLLIVGGTGGAICTGYYWLHYHQRGDFDSAHAADVSGMPMRGAMHGDGL